MKKTIVRKRIKDISKVDKKIVDISNKASKIDIDAVIKEIKPDEVVETKGRMDTGVRLYRGDFKISAEDAKRIDDAAEKAKEERKKEPIDFIKCPWCGYVSNLYNPSLTFKEKDSVPVYCLECEKHFEIVVKIYYKYVCKKL